MTTSGSFTFDPSFAALLDEAAERAGMDPSTLTHRHISSAKMSLNLMLTQWAVTDGDALYRVAQGTTTLVASDDTFSLATGATDVLDLVMAYNSVTYDSPLRRISRQDYLSIADKTSTGRPSVFYVDQSALNAPVVTVWPVPDQSCTIKYDYMRTVQTVAALGDTFDVQRLWLEAVAAGLAERLAAKFNVDRLPILIPQSREAYMLARRAGSGNSQVIIQTRGFGSARTRRR